MYSVKCTIHGNSGMSATLNMCIVANILYQGDKNNSNDNNIASNTKIYSLECPCMITFRRKEYFK